MHEDCLRIIRDAFDEYTDFSLTDVSAEDTLISAKFTYQGSPLTLYVSDPSNNYLRRIMVCIEDRIADDLKIPAHYIRYNNQDKQSVLCLLDKEQHVLSACSLSELIDLYLGQTQSLLSLSPWQKKAEYLKEFEFYWNAACKRIGNTDNQAEVYLPASETAALLSCWYTKNNGIGKYVFFPEGVTFNSSNIPQGTQSTAVYIPIEFPSGIIPPRGNAPWNAHDLLDIICNQTKDRISAKSYDFLKNLQIDNYQKPLVLSFSQPESVTITITGILSFNTNKKKTLICKIQEDFKAFTPIKSSRMDLKYLQERVGQQYAVLPAILLIGCGSVGSYILPELVNLGAVNIGVSDPDEFVSGNALRHHLGPRSHGFHKTDEMKFFTEYENPLVTIESVPNLLDMNESGLAKTLAKYQVVIVAVGGTDLQKKFNFLFSKISSTSWFLYNWLDAAGKGAHVLAMRYSHKGCFNCLFFENGEPISRNKLSYADGTEMVIGNGCGGSFSPYGNNVLVRNTSVVLSVLQGVLDGSITQNTVTSIRNDFSSLESSITIAPDINMNFAEERCDICGHI